MENEKFGSIFYNDKMIDLDTASIEELEKISSELNAKEESLMSKVTTVFKQ